MFNSGDLSSRRIVQTRVLSPAAGGRYCLSVRTFPAHAEKREQDIIAPSSVFYVVFLHRLFAFSFLSENAAMVLRYYQELYLVCEKQALGLSRYIESEFKKNDVVFGVPCEWLPPLCCSFIITEGTHSSSLYHLRDFLLVKVQEYFQTF